MATKGMLKLQSNVLPLIETECWEFGAKDNRHPPRLTNISTLKVKVASIYLDLSCGQITASDLVLIKAEAPCDLGLL